MSNPTQTSSTENRGRFVWHELMTLDPSAARSFYENVIGWTSSKSDMPGMDYYLFNYNEMPMAGMMALPMPGIPPMWIGYTEVPDCDATVKQAQELGATLDAGPMDVEGVGRFASLRDPQGAAFAVITSAMALPPEGDPTPGTFSWHELVTSDQAAGIKFYETLFGWKKMSEMDMGAMGTYYMYGRDRFTYGGMMTKAPEVPYSYWMHYISVADSADAANERAIKLGAKNILPPMEVPGGDRIAVLTDPQGANFAVHSKP